MTGWGEIDPIVDAYAELWWDAKLDHIFKSTYLGSPCIQHPGDAWVTQEIISETRPEVIVECGRLLGGSTIMWAHLLELLEIDGFVVSVEVLDGPLEARERPIWKRRVREVNGSSIDPAVVAQVAKLTAGRRTMVILDSNHSQAHVEGELNAYAPMVTPGCYCIVQDGFVSRYDPSHGPGPLEATLSFLDGNGEFEVDRSRERMLHTLNPSGFLRRVGGELPSRGSSTQPPPPSRTGLLARVGSLTGRMTSSRHRRR